MFDNFIFTEGSFHNVTEEGKTVGFEMSTLLPYYRGIPLSMINDFQVTVDGAAINRESILFSTGQEIWFSLSELDTVTACKWEYGQQGFVRVKKEGGLGAGEHEVTLTVITRTAYIPVPLVGVRTRKITIA